MQRRATTPTPSRPSPCPTDEPLATIALTAGFPNRWHLKDQEAPREKNEGRKGYKDLEAWDKDKMLIECYGVRERQGERAERVVRPRRWRGGATNTTDDPPTLLPSRSGPSVIAIKKSQQAPGTKATSSGIADSEDTLPDAITRAHQSTSGHRTVKG